jgi:transposase
MPRRAYPSDVTDEEWLFVSPYLTLMREDAPQREDDLREGFNGLCWVVRTGAQWRMMPNDLPPWHTVYQQSRRWLKAKVFEAMVHGLRELLRVAGGRNAQPSAVVLDGRTLQSTPESGESGRKWRRMLHPRPNWRVKRWKMRSWSRRCESH